MQQAGVRTIMCSYNAINGTPSCAHQDLFTELVRDTWGFNGYVVSDCDAIQDIYTTHHYTSTPEAAAADALGAGVDLDCGDFYFFLEGALNRGLVDGLQIQTAVERLFTERIALGMLDNPALNPYAQIGPQAIGSVEHAALATQAAHQSIVLLNNSVSLLPLNATSPPKLAVIGPNADQ